MRLVSMEFDDDEDLSSVVVSMTVDEAALVCLITGRLTDPESEALLPVRDGAHHGIYSCLAGAVFDRVYEDGVSGHRPKDPG